MTAIPNDYARCSGKGHDGPGGEMLHSECLECRRREPVSEDAYRVVMIGPAPAPCPNRIEPEEA